MKKLLDENDVDGATKFVQESCKNLVEGKVPFGQLTITKSLRADYADPSRIAHKALADRIAQRDAGNAPAAGDRIPYIYIRQEAGQQAAKLQGDRIETPSYIREKGLTPDYRFYIEHQIANPVSQMFGILLDRMPGFDASMLKDSPTDPIKLLAWRESRAADILFNECLRICDRLDTRAFGLKFFGNGSVKANNTNATGVVNNTKDVDVKPVPRRIKIVPTSNNKITPVKHTQMCMSSYLMDTMLIKEVKTDEAKKKREAKKESGKESTKR
jgi:hypothetical protein